MEIVVLLKQVPSTESLVEIAGDGVSIKADDIKWVINPYDELAVEEALKIKAASGGQVTILSIGPEKAVEAIRTALAMGADKAVRIDADGIALDGLSAAKILAAALKGVSHDLIIAGHRAVDDDNHQVGPAVAEMLGIPNASMVIKQEISEGKIQCHCTVEGGVVIVETTMPALITTQRGLNEPRYASLPGIMKAKKKPIEVKTLSDIGLDKGALAPKTQIRKMSPPPERSGGRIIDGESTGEKVETLVKALRDEVKVI